MSTSDTQRSLTNQVLPRHYGKKGDPSPHTPSPLSPGESLSRPDYPR